MSFMAGIITRGGILEDQLRAQFWDTFTAMERESLWPLEKRETSKHILVKAGFSHMWQGPKMLAGENYDAVATGVQWRKIPNSRTALEYLESVLLTEGRKIENYFDYFSCAIVDNNNHHAILATDPLGMSPVLYKFDSEVLVFSSHQTFLRRYLCQDVEINWQAVFEYLVIGHNIGNKTLLRNVNILSPGCKLEMRQNNLQIIQYKKFDNVNIEKKMTLEDATDIIFEHMTKKRDGYSALAQKNFASFLSGGWDTRFIVSLLAPTGRLAMTYTTQQSGARFNNRLISEKNISREVARHIGVNNKFIAPMSGEIKNRNKRARIMDFATWFHIWSFAMTEVLPYDRFILCDGFFGDVWLTGTYITQALHRCLIDQNRQEAIKLLHRQYLKGFNFFTPNIEVWKSVINSHHLDDFAEVLMRDISEEIYNIHSENFVTLYLFKNRGRRGISPLPRLIFGRKGAVILPFCDFEFVQKALSIPIEYKLDHSLYKALLEKSKPGLSSIASTNTKDPEKLEPYLVSILSAQSFRVRIAGTIQERYPRLYKVLKGMKNLVSGSGSDSVWIKEIFENPPNLFMDVLAPELKQAIEDGNTAYVRNYRPFIEVIMPLNSFFAEKEISCK